MRGPWFRIDDVEGLLAPVETGFDEWKQHPVFFVGVMKKGADVTMLVKHRACETNGLAGITRRSSTGLHTIMSGNHRILLRQAAATVQPLAARKESSETVARTQRQTPRQEHIM